MTKHLDLTLNEGFEYSGLWWLPNNPDNQIGGTLSYSPNDGVHLGLIGSFRDLGEERSEFEVINGITSNGILCTLFHNGEVHFTHGWPGFLQQRFRCGLLLLGHEITSLEEFVFEKCHVSYEHLETWIPGSVYDSSFESIDDHIRFTIVAEPKEWFNEQSEAINGRIRIASNLSSRENTAQHLDLSGEVFVTFEPETAQPIQHFRRWLADLQLLFSILVGERTNPRKIHASFDQGEDQELRDKKLTSVFYRSTDSDLSREVHQMDMLLPMAKMQGQLAKALDLWLTAEHGVRQAIFLFFSVDGVGGVDPETKFVNVVHALESLQRSTGEGFYMSAEEYDPYRKEMINAIPERIQNGHRAALVSRLRYGHEYSQRKRLAVILSSLENETSALVTKDPGWLIDKTVDTRNYFVHRDEALKANALEWPALVHVYHRLRILTTILLLKYIGLDEATIRAAVAKNRRLNSFVGNEDDYL